MDPHPPRRCPEPTGLTMGDLVALVAGVALVAALPWEGRPESLRIGRGWLSPWNFSLALAIVGEGLGKACSALVPVVLARCAQNRRLVRPGEFLVAAAGLPWLASGLDGLVFSRWAARQQGATPGMTESPAALRNEWVLQVGWPRCGVMLAMAVVAGLLVAVGRKRLPRWVASLMLMLTWLGVHDGLPFLVYSGIAAFVYPYSMSNDFYLVTAFAHLVVVLPFLLLYAVPLIAAKWSTSQHRVWFERLGMVLALLSFPADALNRLLIDFLVEETGMFRASVIAKIAAAAGAVGLGVVLLRRYGPTWSRWFTPMPEGSGPGSIPSEA